MKGCGHISALDGQPNCGDSDDLGIKVYCGKCWAKHFKLNGDARQEKAE